MELAAEALTDLSAWRDGSVAHGQPSSLSPTGKPAVKRKSSVHVRLPQDEEDWQQIRHLVRKHHVRTFFSGTPLSERKLDAAIAKARQPLVHQCVIVAEAKGRLVGMAWFSAGEYILTEGDLLTTAHIIAVDAQGCGPYLAARTFVKLVRGMTAWSKSVGAGRVLVHVTTGVDIKATDRLLGAGGAECIGGGYVIG